MNVTTKIKMDLCQPDVTLGIDAVQGERSSRSVEISLYTGVTTWMIPPDITVAIRYRKPDGTGGYYDTLPDGNTAWSIQDNLLTVILAPQMLTAAGTVLTQIEMIQGNNTLSTFGFKIFVEENPASGCVKSEDYVNWLQWIKEQSSEHAQSVEQAAAEAADASESAAASANAAMCSAQEAQAAAVASAEAETAAEALRAEVEHIAGEVAAIVAGNEAYTKQESDLRYASVILGTAKGQNIHISDSMNAPLHNLKLYGKTIQNGTPTPDCPIPLISTGNIGKIDITMDCDTNQQVLMVSTPNGLSGIKVKTGGNWTDEAGQQWICDEIDLARGKHVQRVFHIPLDENIFEHYNVLVRTVSGRSTITISGVPSIAGANGTGQTGTVMMSTFTNLIGAWGEGKCVMWENGTLGEYQCNIAFNTEFIPAATQDAFISFFTAHPGEILIGMHEPVESDLAQSELTQYAAMQTHYPSTIISNDADTEMEVSYLADTKHYLDNKFAALSELLATQAR